MVWQIVGKHLGSRTVSSEVFPGRLFRVASSGFVPFQNVAENFEFLWIGPRQDAVIRGYSRSLKRAAKRLLRSGRRFPSGGHLGANSWPA